MARYKTRAKRSKAHPGFKSVASSIAKRQGIPLKRADAILGAATHRNPVLRARAEAHGGHE